jgi:hypothetical protein
MIEVALADYDEPRAGGRQLSGSELRQDLRALLLPPPSLTLAEQGGEIVIRVPAQPDRRFAADRPQSRTDAAGTAEIRATWRGDDSLQISESYDRRRKHTENYALQRDGTLVITREVERPGVKRLRARSVYRRG